jgi:hypothetical protein
MACPSRLKPMSIKQRECATDQKTSFAVDSQTNNTSDADFLPVFGVVHVKIREPPSVQNEELSPWVTLGMFGLQRLHI